MIIIPTKSLKKGQNTSKVHDCKTTKNNILNINNILKEFNMEYKISKVIHGGRNYGCLLFPEYDDMIHFLDQNHEKYELVDKVMSDSSYSWVYIVMKKGTDLVTKLITREQVVML